MLKVVDLSCKISGAKFLVHKFSCWNLVRKSRAESRAIVDVQFGVQFCVHVCVRFVRFLLQILVRFLMQINQKQLW